MTFTDAAAEVLRLVGRPLHYKEITDIAIEKNLLSHVGKSPEVTMGARLAAMLKKDSPENPLIRVKPGVFGLRDWDEKTIKAGLEGKKKRGKVDEERPREEEEAAAPGLTSDEPAEAVAGAEDDTVAAEESAGDHDAAGLSPDDDEPARAEMRPGAPRPSRPMLEEEEGPVEPAGPDDIMRAEAAAGAAEMFDEEDDDDQPILGATDDRATPGGVDLADGRRRRRRRRRGRTVDAAPAPQGPGQPPVQVQQGQGGLPTYTATPAYERRDNGRDAGREQSRDAGREQSRDQSRDAGREQSRDQSRDASRDQSRDASRDRERDQSRELAPGDLAYRGPQVIDLTGGDAHALDDLAGKDLADAVAALLGTLDRNAGAASLRQIAEAAQRRGRLQGEVQLVQSQIAAAIRADNARRMAAGQRVRFRFAGGRVALTDWLLSSDLARFEQDALVAVERYRDAARRAFARKLGELPGHAFIEICVLALERAGISQLRAIRRAGAPGGEAHFAGGLKSISEDIRVAVVIRRDGREVGRERVTELRGALHHYGPATGGFLLTAGQVLSGAREEAAVTGAAPIQLFDGLNVARLCEDHDVAVLRARLPIAIPDVDLLEALRAS
jgi:hypothetical protein